MIVEESSKWNFCYVMPDPEGSPEKVQNFMDLVKPIAEGYSGRKPAKQARGGGAGG
jgi:hypothetical protein